jgi:hypothetical protein
MELDPADYAHLDAPAVARSDGFLVVQSGPRSWTLNARLRQDVEGFSGLEPVKTCPTKAEAMRAAEEMT